MVKYVPNNVKDFLYCDIDLVKMRKFSFHNKRCAAVELPYFLEFITKNILVVYQSFVSECCVSSSREMSKDSVFSWKATETLRRCSFKWTERQIRFSPINIQQTVAFLSFVINAFLNSQNAHCNTFHTRHPKTTERATPVILSRASECVVGNSGDLSVGSPPEWCKTGVCTASGKVISEAPINCSDTQNLRRMFLISSPCTNIMAEEFTATVISCYQRLTALWQGPGCEGLMGSKATGNVKAWSIIMNIHCEWLVQMGKILYFCSNLLVFLTRPIKIIGKSIRTRAGSILQRVSTHASRSSAPPAGSSLSLTTEPVATASPKPKKTKFVYLYPILPTAQEAIIPLHISHWRLFGYPFCTGRWAWQPCFDSHFHNRAPLFK